MEASKTKVINRKTETLEDMENVVDDFKSALKTQLSNKSDSVKVTDPLSDHKGDNHRKCDTETPPSQTDKEEIRPFNRGPRSRTISETVTKHLEEEDSKLPQGQQSGGHDILGTLDMYTLASQTHDFFGGLLGNKSLLILHISSLFPSLNI